MLTNLKYPVLAWICSSVNETSKSGSGADEVSRGNEMTVGSSVFSSTNASTISGIHQMTDRLLRVELLLYVLTVRRTNED